MDHSPFARLSPELRNEVYRLCFDEDRNRLPEFPFTGVCNYKDSVALTQVCRFLRAECRAMFWSGRTISLTIAREKHAKQLCNFLEVLGPEMVQSLSSLRLIIHGQTNPETMVRRIEFFISSTPTQSDFESADGSQVLKAWIEPWAFAAEGMIPKTLARMKIDLKAICGAYDGAICPVQEWKGRLTRPFDMRLMEYSILAEETMSAVRELRKFKKDGR